jgi:hypothetical protein
VMLPQLKCLPTLLLGVSLSQVEELSGARGVFLSASRQFSISCSVKPHDCHSYPFPPISLYVSYYTMAGRG